MPLGAADQDGDGKLDYFDPTFDDDLDGLDNFQEFVVHGTDNARKDTDGDGVDGQRGDQRRNAIRSSTIVWRCALSWTRRKTSGSTPRPCCGSCIHGELLISRGATGFRLDLQLEGSVQPGGAVWQPLGPPVQWFAPPPDSNTYFYRVRASRP